MSFWDLRRLQQHYTKYNSHNVYLISGEDAYLIDESVHLIKKKTLDSGLEDFNLDSFWVKDVHVSEICDRVETLPMMSSQRLVILKGIESLKAQDWEKLLPYIESPVEQCVFVLVTYDKVDKRKKYVKAVLKNGVALELKRPFDNQMPAWIQYIAAGYELSFSSSAVAVFQQYVGNNLYEVKNEILKLKQYLGDKTQVEQEDVERVVSRTRIESVFELTDAIGSRDTSKALISLTKLLEQGQNEVGILALVLRHVRILASIKEGQDQGLKGVQLSSKVGVPKFFYQKYLSQANLWKDDSIKTTMHSLSLTDKALKSSPVSSQIWIENFIIRSCSI